MKVVTAVVNNPAFIEMQYHTLKKYLRCGGGNGDDSDYEFIVFNDAKAFPDFTNEGDITLKSQIAETCRRLGITCITLENERHRTVKQASVRCADAMNAILRYQLERPPDKYLLIDSDMFLIDYLDINKYSAYACAVVLQNRPNLNYIWNGVYYFDFNKMQQVKLLNWNEGHGGDVGGMMGNWFAEQTLRRGFAVPKTEDLRWAPKEQTFHQSGDIYYIRHLWSCSWDESELPEHLKTPAYALLRQFLKEDVRNVGGKFYCEIYDDVFLHYRAGGNWNKEGLDFHKRLTERLGGILTDKPFSSHNYFLDFGTHRFEGLEEFIPKLGIDKTFQVYCYEPNKPIYDASRENIQKYEKQFHAFNHFNLAVMDYTGEIIFNSHNGAWKNSDKETYIKNYTTGSNCLDINPKYDAGNGVVFDIESTKCGCIDIEEIISSIVVKDPSAQIYIKCDIEGSEFVVLPKLLASSYVSKVKNIYIEWHERFWYGTEEYPAKVNLRKNIINSFDQLNIKNFVHS